MIFIQNLNTDFPLNAFNDNIIEVEEPSAATLQIWVSGAGNFYVTGINGYFYFNFKEVFKVLVNENLFADDFDYTQIIRDSNLSHALQVNYSTINSEGIEVDGQEYNYRLLKSVHQIEEVASENLYLHHEHNDEITLDVFKGYPFDFTFYNKETSDNNLQILPSVSVGMSSSFPLETIGVYRIPLIDKDGSTLHQYSVSNHLSLIEGVQNTIKVQTNYGQFFAKLNTHERCKGIYIKWLNTYGGWDYWLFSDKAKVSHKDKITGKVYTGFDNIQNLNSIESSLGKVLRKSYSLSASFLNESQFAKIIRLEYSPKVYLWTGYKFIEVFITNKTKYTANEPQGEANFTIEIPKRITQTA